MTPDRLNPVPPQVTWPARAMIGAAAVAGWYDATDDERREKVLPRYRQLLAEWESLGATLVWTFDDELFSVGPPSTAAFSHYLMVEIPSLEAATEMIQRLRVTVDGVRLDRYLRMELRLGVKLFLADR